MHFIKKNGLWFLLLFAVGDFLMPFFLALFYPGYNPFTQFISDLGAAGTPTESLFLKIEFVIGILAVLGCPTLYKILAPVSSKLAWLSTLAIACFGIGDCIFTGIFSLQNHNPNLTLSDVIHGVGSMIGVAGLMMFPLLLAIAYHKTNQLGWRNIYFTIFIIALITSLLNAMSLFLGFSYPGLIQRFSLIFLYLPVVLFSIRQLTKENHYLI